jgi:hypothetical protein
LVCHPNGRSYIVFENKVPKRIFGPNRDEVTGWRKLLIMRAFIGETSGSYGGEYEDVFWDVAPCSLVEVY